MQSWADCITATHESSFWKRHLRLDQTFLIEATNDGRLDDVGMFDKFRFNLEWRALDAANLQHVIAAVAVVEIALRVTTTGVSGIEPAIDHRRRAAFGIVPITAPVSYTHLRA